MRAPLLESQVLDLPCRRGKVRDVYDLGETLVIVATDRISAFDWVLPTGIPDKGRVVPFECVVRGYLAGSGWKEYRQSGTVCGLPLPPGLRECERLPEPIFTPATKAESGHDVNVSFEEMAAGTGPELAESLRWC